MIRKKSTELTWKILALTGYKSSTDGFNIINPLLLKALENIYIQARLDAEHKVPYELLDDMTLHLPDSD